MHWDLFFTSLAASLPAILAAVLAFIQGLRNHASALRAEQHAKIASEKADATDVVAVKTSEKLDSLHSEVNDRLTQLVAATKLASHAEGMAEGMAKTKADSERPDPR